MDCNVGYYGSVVISDINPSDSPITLITDDSEIVNKDLNTYSTLHINYTGNSQATMDDKDILSTAYKALVSSLNPTALQYVGGALANKEQVVIGRTNYVVSNPADTAGYNCTACSFGDGECCPVTRFDNDFFLQTVELCNQLAIRLDVTANIQLADVTWQAQIAWKITHCTNRSVTPKHILIGQEEVTGVNDIYWLGVPATTNAQYTQKAQLYVAKANPELVTLKAANPTKKFYFDTAEVASTGNRDKLWNDEMDSGYTNDGCRVYMNLNNLLAYPNSPLTTDYNNNLVIINNAIFNIAPSRFNTFRSKFPNKSAAVYQWGLRNPGAAVNIENTVLGMLLQAKMMKMFLDYNYNNSDLISYASYQDLKQFINSDNTTTNQILALLLIGKMFTGTPYYIQSMFNLGENIGGVAVKDSTTYRILIWNDGAAVNNIGKLSIDGSDVSSWTRESYYGTSLSGTTITHYPATSESSLSVPAFSVNIIQI